MNSRAVCLLLGAASALFSWPGPSVAEPLKPDELLLVYNRDDSDSKELAEYYAKARGVPADRLLAVRAQPREEEVSREHFERFIRTPIRAHLQSQPYGPRIRCIVLFYGLPIRVGAKKGSAVEQHLAEQWRKELQGGISKLNEVTDAMSAIASQPAPASAPAKADEQNLGAAAARYEAVRNQTARRVDALHRAGKGQQEFAQTMGLIQAVEGTYSVAMRAKASSNLASENTTQVEQALKKFEEDETRIGELLARGLADPARAQARQIILQNHGIMGYIKSLVHDINLTRTDETVSSVDSELTLVRWDAYTLSRWVPNLLSWRIRSGQIPLMNVTNQQLRTPVLMTCRIDGPSKRVARRIIDDSIAAEKAGLNGRVYLDARGLHDDKRFAEYDDNLRELSTLLTQETKVSVTLDDKAGVFGPGSCPNAMLYCGWYSLRQFVDAFEFVPGAIAYHLASFEAISIKAPVEKGWVKGLLNDGVAATVGSVAEPYLQSFPRPKQFFGLLLTGRFTLAECYAYTAEFNSWMMLLIGDPLYRPFAASPRLQLEQVFSADQIPPEFRGAASRPSAE